MGNQAKLRPVETVILAMPGTLPTTVAGPMDVFTQAGQLWEQLCTANPSPRFNVRIASIDGKDVTCMNGMQIKPHCVLGQVEQTDLLIVTSANIAERDSWKHSIIPHLERLHRQGTQIASICTGAFVLAEAGLLSGRIATTHWGFVPVFRELYPQVDVRPERMLTQDGSIFCSGGINAYAELCLYLVELWCGYKTAEQLAHALVLDGWREQQTDYSLFEFQKRHGDTAVLKAQNHMESHLREALNVAGLAEIAAMSERNFKRRFKKATGDAPNEYLQRLRIEHAKHRLEHSATSVEVIADQVGYRDVAYFRQVFKQIVGMAPNAYRAKTRIALPLGNQDEVAAA
ncbi:MAG TPA: helix-turn-helix domain-containing protein [Noviherbaspirillum sp.]|nr:helix-turn-helix domain-containing protein [Noviherbaspirillum sp.]